MLFTSVKHRIPYYQSICSSILHPTLSICSSILHPTLSIFSTNSSSNTIDLLTNSASNTGGTPPYATIYLNIFYFFSLVLDGKPAVKFRKDLSDQVIFFPLPLQRTRELFPCLRLVTQLVRDWYYALQFHFVCLLLG